jgi:hypothetical protein
MQLACWVASEVRLPLGCMMLDAIPALVRIVFQTSLVALATVHL